MRTIQFRARTPDKGKTFEIGLAWSQRRAFVIIAISGYGEAGKDTVVAILINRLGYVRRAFADPLKRICADLVDVPVHYWHDRKLKSATLEAHGYPDLTPDQIAVKVGTEVGRNVHPDVWVRKVTNDLAPGERVAFSDCRFPNEAAAVKSLGGIVLRVDRPGTKPRIDRLTGLPHVSDVALDDYAFDARIVNDGTLEDLEKQVLFVLDVFGVKP